MANYILDDIQLGLLSQRIIDLNGEINEDMYDYVRQAISHLQIENSPDITVKITSRGGDLAVALNIYDLLRLYQGQVTGVVLNRAQSGTVVILQACKLRQCAKHAEVLIHNGKRYVEMAEISVPRRLKKTIRGFKEAQAPMDEIFSARTGKSVKQLQKFYLKEKHMSAAEALDFGLIDEII